MITLKTIWMSVIVASIAAMLICRIIMAIRHIMMIDDRKVNRYGV